MRVDGSICTRAGRLFLIFLIFLPAASVETSPFSVELEATTEDSMPDSGIGDTEGSLRSSVAVPYEGIVSSTAAIAMFLLEIRGAF